MKTLLCIAALTLFVISLTACSSSSTAREPYDQELTLIKPSDQVLRRGDTNRVEVTVDRERFKGPIVVRFDGLPRGVRVVELDKRIEADENITNFTLMADSTADLVTDHLVRVTVEGPDRMVASQSFELTVRERS